MELFPHMQPEFLHVLFFYKFSTGFLLFFQRSLVTRVAILFGFGFFGNHRVDEADELEKRRTNGHSYIGHVKVDD